MSHCEHPNCSTPIIKPLSRAHSFLCEKSERYHEWHHNPHHVRAHWTSLLIYSVFVFGLIFNIVGLPKLSNAANGFLANYDSSSLNADSATGSSVASNDGTPADLISTGFGGTGQAARVTNGKTLKYSATSNLSDSEGTLSMKVKYPGKIQGDWDGSFSSVSKMVYIDSTDYLYTVDTTNNRVVVVKSDGVTGWRSFGSTGTGDGQLNQPSGIAVDANGDIYVSERNNHRIQIFTNAGVPKGWIGRSSTDAGWHAVGSGKVGISGNGDYMFNTPFDVAVDTSGKIYVADSANYRIQIYDSDATHTMIGWIGKYAACVAGTKCWSAVGSGRTGATGTSDYNFNYPTGVRVDASGKIYVADYQNYRVQIYDSDATHTMIGWIGKYAACVAGTQCWSAVGSGRTGVTGAGDYNFNYPLGIGLDSTGKIYVTDTSNHRIQVYDSDATHTMLGWIGKDDTGVGSWHAVGSGKSGSTTYSGSGDYQFGSPVGVAASTAGKIFVADTNNYRVQFYDTTVNNHNMLGWVGKDNTSVPGWHAIGSGKTGGNTVVTNNLFNGVTAFSYSQASGKMFMGNNQSGPFNGGKIIESKFDGTDWTSFTTDTVSSIAYSLYYDEASQRLFVSENNGGSRVTILYLDGSKPKVTIDIGGPPLSGITYDAVNNRIYCTTMMAYKVYIINPDDPSSIVSMGTYGTGTGQFGMMGGLRLVPDPGDAASPYIYVVDTGNNRIVKTKFDGSWTGWTTYGTTGAGAGNFSSPRGIAYDSGTQYFYITDSSNYRIVKTKLDGAWTGWTTYGSQGVSGAGKVSQLTNIDFDSSTGLVYAADPNNYRIIKTDMTDPSWSTYNGIIPQQVLFQSSTSGSSARLEIDPFRGKVLFYPSYDSASVANTVAVSSASLSWLPDSWHAISASYKQSTGELSLTVDGVTTTATTSWSAPAPNYGDYFYLGSEPNGGYDTFSGLIDKVKLFNQFSDLINPTSPTTLVTKSASGGIVLTPTVANWYNHANPYFSWDAATDANGIDGYYVYFGTNPAADPATTSGTINANGSAYWTESLNATVAGTMVTGSTYYLRVKSKDNFGNVTIWDPTSFKYQFESTAPLSPTSNYISVSPTGFSQVKDFTFSWPLAGAANSAYDPGVTDNPVTGSGLHHYEYKINPEGTWTTIAPGDTTPTGFHITPELDLGSNVINKGSNTFMLRVVDNANNPSVNVSQAIILYDPDAARQAPQNLTVTPSTSKASPAVVNSFTISWTAPAIPQGNSPVANYYYAINDNVSDDAKFVQLSSSTTSIGPSAYATKQGRNVVYVTTKNEAGNANFIACRLLVPSDPDSTDDAYDAANDGCARKFFYANTPAPGYPAALKAVDGSDRELKDYTVFLKWSAPTDTGTGFNGYNIYRSTDGINFGGTPIGTIDGSNAGTSYADSNLQSIPYYYKVVAKDMAGQVSADSDVINITPTGRFTKAPILVDGSLKITPKAYSSNIAWETQDTDSKVVHKASSFIEYGVSADKIGNENGGYTTGQLSLDDSHSVTITGLKPDGYKYYYQAVWVDQDGNTGRSELASFVTLDRPKALNIEVTNIGLNTATISYDTTVPATTEITYGPSTSLDQRYTDLSSFATKHTVVLKTLNHSTKYYYNIGGTDTDGNAFDTGIDASFATLTMPVIKGQVAFEQDKTAPTTTYRFVWETNIETTTIINYEGSDGRKLSKSIADYTVAHDLTIPDLADMSTYKLIVTGRDRNGNEIETPFSTSVDTPKDSRPPKISNMTIEVKSTSFGATQKAQIVATWQTDELATSQIEYEQGISGNEYKNKSKEDPAFSNSHVVILSELEPSKIYHLRAVSKDAAGNSGYSEDTTTITGKMQNSVLDIIINSLERSLGWMFTIFKR